jgi:hypothetical protein
MKSLFRNQKNIKFNITKKGVDLVFDIVGSAMKVAAGTAAALAARKWTERYERRRVYDNLPPYKKWFKQEPK